MAAAVLPVVAVVRAAFSLHLIIYRELPVTIASPPAGAWVRSVGCLVLANHKVAGMGTAEVKAAGAALWVHGSVLRQSDAQCLEVEQRTELEVEPLFGQ